MQEEVTQRTVSLCVEATKFSAGMLQQAMKKVLDEMQKGVTGRKTKLHHGKQPLRQLMKHNTGEIPRYPVFFKGRDADVTTVAFREFSAKNLEKVKKPSIHKELEQVKQQSKAQHRQREMVKTKDRGVELWWLTGRKSCSPTSRICCSSISLISSARRCALRPALTPLKSSCI